jgi:glutamine amidotransferase
MDVFQQPARKNILLPSDSINQSLRGVQAMKQSREIASRMLAMTFFFASIFSDSRMIAVIDYGMGNLRSVHKALEKVGYAAAVTSSPQAVLDAGALILPGVGAFRDCMRSLENLNLIQPILQSVRSGKPFLGICLGLQVLFTESDEFGTTPGLNLISGRVVRFAPDETPGAERLKIPHMGWNTISKRRSVPILNGIEDGSFFYFVHSYFVVPENTPVTATVTGYGIEFTSSIQKDNIFACQFHPEKSQGVGLRLLKNFGTWAGEGKG